MAKGKPRHADQCVDCALTKDARNTPRPIYRTDRCYPHWLRAIRSGVIIA